MKSEEGEKGRIRASFLALEVLWTLFALYVFAYALSLHDSLIKNEETVTFLTGSAVFLIFSLFSIFILIYAEFINKCYRDMTLYEKLRDRKHRYHIILLIMLIVLTPLSIMYKFNGSYGVALFNTLLLIFIIITIPTVVFLFSFMSSGFHIKEMMNEHSIGLFFLSIVIVLSVSSAYTLMPIMEPDVKFYRDSMENIPDFGYYNGTTMAYLGVANYGILPAKDIEVLENGSTVYRISVLKGSEVLKFHVPVECSYNCSDYDQNESDIYEPSCCKTNLILIYEGRVVDRITTIYTERNTCTDVLLIMSAPLALLIRKRRR